MPDESLSQSDPSPQPTEVCLTIEEWQEISDCSTAFFAALKCYEHHGDEAWELVVSVHQRFQRAFAPINERLSDELHGNSH